MNLHERTLSVLACRVSAGRAGGPGGGQGGRSGTPHSQPHHAAPRKPLSAPAASLAFKVVSQQPGGSRLTSCAPCPHSTCQKW